MTNDNSPSNLGSSSPSSQTTTSDLFISPQPLNLEPELPEPPVTVVKKEPDELLEQPVASTAAFSHEFMARGLHSRVPPEAETDKRDMPDDEPGTQSLNFNEARTSPDSPSNSWSQPKLLKIEDALFYLDQVKFRFGDQPEAYNYFLEIMKDFKMQAIDTIGVIQRVTQLFEGHPELICGFKTFLPMGFKPYKDSPSNLNGPSTTFPVNHENKDGTTISAGPDLRIYSLSEGINIVTSSPLASTESLGGSNDETHTPLFTHSPTSPFVLSTFPLLRTHPVEFNFAINYVKKIKSLFQSQGEPGKYYQFLDVLHSYKKEQENRKGVSTSSKNADEQEVFSRVAKLFEKNEDLLEEFKKFLPFEYNDATPLVPSEKVKKIRRKVVRDKTKVKSANKPTKEAEKSKRSSRNCLAPPKPKKSKLSSTKDILLSAQLRSKEDKTWDRNGIAFFDKVKQVVGNKTTYDSFLRCFRLFDSDMISKKELVVILAPYLHNHPELHAWFKEIIEVEQESNGRSNETDEHCRNNFFSAKRIGSYHALPRNYNSPTCSGRTKLCKEVLNDVWLSYPDLTDSENYSFSIASKNMFEEKVFRCEEERFELDIVIETNISLIRALEAVVRKMGRMTQEELQTFTLDECLGGTSPTIHLRAVRRIYGDKCTEIIEGLKRYPAIAVPVVLRRLKEKAEEWREAQKGFNKIWREQLEAFHLKSLDHQGVTFKQKDLRALRSRTLINQIETKYYEHQDQKKLDCFEGDSAHLILPYNRRVLKDACNLLIYYIKLQTTFDKEDKRKMKEVLRVFLSDIFQYDENEFPEFEKDGTLHNGEKREIEKRDKECYVDEHERVTRSQFSESTRSIEEVEEVNYEEVSDFSDDLKNISPLDLRIVRVSKVEEESCKLYYANNSWYVFLRLHQILCERLSKMHERAKSILHEEEMSLESGVIRRPGVTLHLFSSINEIPVHEYYSTLLEMIKSLLVGDLELTEYEDTLREMFGINAYISFTLDKVVINAVKQLQEMVTEKKSMLAMEMFYQTDREKTTKVLYEKRAQRAFAQVKCIKIMIFKNDCRMTMELQKLKSNLFILNRYIRKYKNQREMSIEKELTYRFTNTDENLQCRNPNSYKMNFILQNKDVSYLKGATSVKRAREGEIFGRWHQNWVEDNVSDDQITKCKNWLLSSKNSNAKYVSNNNNDLDNASDSPVNIYLDSPNCSNT